MPLTDGRTVDEALTPAEMVSPEGRELYGLMYEQLAEGRELTLSVLLADLAERGLDRLSGLAAAMEAEVDAFVSTVSPGSAGKATNEVLAQKLMAAAQCLIAHHRAAERRETVEPVSAEAPDEALRRAIEMRKANRSPLSIMRTQK